MLRKTKANRKILSLIALIVIAAIVPLTVVLSLTQQETRQRASGPEETLPTLSPLISQSSSEICTVPIDLKKALIADMKKAIREQKLAEKGPYSIQLYNNNTKQLIFETKPPAVKKPDDITVLPNDIKVNASGVYAYIACGEESNNIDGVKCTSIREIEVPSCSLEGCKEKFLPSGVNAAACSLLYPQLTLKWEKEPSCLEESPFMAVSWNQIPFSNSSEADSIVAKLLDITDPNSISIINESLFAQYGMGISSNNLVNPQTGTRYYRLEAYDKTNNKSFGFSNIISTSLPLCEPSPTNSPAS